MKSRPFHARLLLLGLLALSPWLQAALTDRPRPACAPCLAPRIGDAPGGGVEACPTGIGAKEDPVVALDFLLDPRV